MRSKTKPKASIRQPKTEKAQETRRCLEEAAAQILLAEGIDGVNTNKIAEKAGVSIGTLYQYYPHKEAILLALVDRSLEARMQRLQKAIDLKSALLPVDLVLVRIIDALFDSDSRREAELEMHLFPALVLAKAGLAKKYQAKVDDAMRPLTTALLAIRFPKLLTRNLEVIVFMLSQTLRGCLVGLTLAPDQQKNIPDLKRELVRMLNSYLAA